MEEKEKKKKKRTEARQRVFWIRDMSRGRLVTTNLQNRKEVNSAPVYKEWQRAREDEEMTSRSLKEKWVLSTTRKRMQGTESRHEHQIESQARPPYQVYKKMGHGFI